MKITKKRSIRIVTALSIIGCLYAAFCLLNPLPPLYPDRSLVQLNNEQSVSNVIWPTASESAIGVNQSGVVARYGSTASQPIASTAKLITSLAVLQKKPLTIGDQGPVLTLSANDLALYSKYVSESGSVATVVAGEQISEYQALQAMLLPSANNIADSLAIWAFGSLPNYTSYANALVKGLGMNSTKIGVDASGFDPSTVSTAHDLVILGEAAMRNPVIAQIVDQKTAEIPVAGSISNVNNLLGSDGIIGIKTGNTDQAGGVFISGSNQTVAGQQFLMVTAVLGAPNLSQALHMSQSLIRSATANIRTVPIVSAQEVIGSYALPWGGMVTAQINQNFSALSWNGTKLSATAVLKPISSKTAVGKAVGTISAPSSLLSGAQTEPITLSSAIPQPDLLWRFEHPLLR